MKNQTNFRVQMMRVKGDLAPFAQVDFVDQDAKEHTALMVVDSCSCHNILFGFRAQQHGLVMQAEEGTMNIECAGNEMVTTNLAKFYFVLGGEQFHESFCIMDGEVNIPKKVDELPIVGVLGNIFMQQHNLAIDYSDYTLHTSDVSPENLPISDCDFFFPMEIGLERYGVPVLAVRQNGNDLVAMADTGATNNMIASQTIEDNGFECQVLDTTDVVSGIAGSAAVKDAMVRFSLLTLTEDDTEVVHHEDSFKLTSEYMITPEEGKCDKNGVQLPPVVGVIGSPFMAKEGWVLDFGVKYIYKRKVVKPVEMIARVPSRVEKSQPAAADKESKRSIPLFADPIEKGLPFIRIEEGDFEGLVMLIDTGSNDNSIFGFAYRQLEDLFTSIEGQRNVYGINGNPITVNCIRGCFSFCGKEYEMNFLLNEEDGAFVQLSQEMGFPISGIIGTSFMAEHGWVLDYGKQEVVIPAIDVSIDDLKNIEKRTSKKE